MGNETRGPSFPMMSSQARYARPRILLSSETLHHPHPPALRRLAVRDRCFRQCHVSRWVYRYRAGGEGGFFLGTAILVSTFKLVSVTDNAAE